MASSIHCQNTCSHHHHHHHHLEVSPDCPFHGFHLQSIGHGHHHHHHHLELSPQCPLHSSLLHLQPTNHRHHHHHHLLPRCPPHTHQNNRCPNFTSPVPSIPTQNPQPTVSISSLNNLNSPVPDPSEIIYPHSLNEELEPEDEEEFEFVLTDEWKEFFAKSEAKRRSAKKHAKRKGKE